MAVDVTITTRIGRTPADVFAALTAVERFPSGSSPRASSRSSEPTRPRSPSVLG